LNENAVQTESVMSDEQFSLAQEQFMQTVGAAGWDTMSRADFIIAIAVPYATTIPYREEATRLVVHYEHMIEHKKVVDDMSTAQAMLRIRAYTPEESRHRTVRRSKNLHNN